MAKTQTITLRIVVEDGEAPVQEWDWNTLLDTTEDVEVLAVYPANPE